MSCAAIDGAKKLPELPGALSAVLFLIEIILNSVCAQKVERNCPRNRKKGGGEGVVGLIVARCGSLLYSNPSRLGEVLGSRPH